MGKAWDARPGDGRRGRQGLDRRQLERQRLGRGDWTGGTSWATKTWPSTAWTGSSWAGGDWLARSWRGDIWTSAGWATLDVLRPAAGPRTRGAPARGVTSCRARQRPGDEMSMSIAWTKSITWKSSTDTALGECPDSPLPLLDAAISND